MTGTFCGTDRTYPLNPGELEYYFGTAGSRAREREGIITPGVHDCDLAIKDGGPSTSISFIGGASNPAEASVKNHMEEEC